MKTFVELCHFLNYPLKDQDDFTLQHLVTDSRKVMPGDVFCAYQGKTGDGHDYIQAAVERGAALILSEKSTKKFSVPVLVITDLTKYLSRLAAWFYDQPSQKLKIIGVTGTNGKTSTTHYLVQFLYLLGHKVGVIGTVGNGLWGQLKLGDYTTPEPAELQRELAELLQQGAEYVCMEVSSHALALGRVNDITFISAVFTNLTQDHLDFHGTMEEYARAKAKLFAWPNLKTAILNKDDVAHTLMTQQVALNTKIYYYSLQEHHEALAYAEHLSLAAQGLSFTLHSPFGTAPIKTALLGEFNAGNMLAALTTLLSLNFSLKELAKLAILVQPVKGRMEVLCYPDLPLVVIDYAHTPDALKKALEALKIYERPLWVVFGCGGNRDAGKRPRTAAIAEQYAHQVLVTEDNSRLENPEQIFADIRQGFQHPERTQFIPKRRDAIFYALEHAPKDAIILLAGKGHETYLDTQGKKIHFDEREVVKSFS
jgi:UDP-N-acetylmuramoyl-L-alanyl-D-glutamate--2,6-diaminopimelate ligase